MDEASNEKGHDNLERFEFLYKRKIHNATKQMLRVDNLAELGSLTEDIILSHLLERYLNNQIYTYIGDILIAVNPLQTLNLYGPEHSKMYKNSQKSALPPHIFMVADMTHQAMIHNKNPQCCLISGESGAGKTVSADYLVRHLAELGKAGNRTLEEKILQVNPLMEALGNAQTVINDNSSRFGKYLELHFTSNGALTGGILSEYLLEKSRVVSQSSYLQTGGRNLQDLVCTLGNRRKFEEVQRCFDIIGFSHEEVSQLFSILAAVIHLGDIHFTEDESVSHLSDKSMVNNPQVLLIVSSLLGINAVELRDALTTNSNVTRGETIVRNNSVDHAIDYRDGMAKALYGKLFSWIVHRINALLRTDKGRSVQNNDYRIGILDIFGFENFKRNSFEQLCINIANEQIQFYFNQQIFSWELEEYRAEGISLERITFTDNRPVSRYVSPEKFHKNIECPHYEKPKENDVYPSFVIVHYAGRVKYDATNFLEKNRDTLSPDIINVLRSSDNRLVRTLMQHPLSRSDFSYCDTDDGARTLDPHWWRVNKPFPDVTEAMLGYKPKEGWLKGILKKKKSHGVSTKKNSSQPAMLQMERDKKVNGLLSLPETKQSPSLSNSTSRWQQTVSVHFRYSLRDLLAKLLPSESHFVRCIRPNEQMVAGKFDQEKVQSQLRYTGVLETTRIRRQGYSERITFAEFMKRYQMIAYPLHKKFPCDSTSCSEILTKSKLENWVIGRTKVFLKYYHVEELARLLEIHRRKVVTLQRVVRGWLVRKHYEKLKRERHHAATVIQKHARGYLGRKYYKQELNKKHDAAAVIQRAYRRLVQRRKLMWWLKWYHIQQRRKVKNAIRIQAVVRGFLIRKRYMRLRRLRHKSATTIQAAYRGHRVRRKLAAIKRSQRKLKERQRVKIRAAVRIQTAYRGHKDRKNVTRLKARAEKRETKVIYFLQQKADVRTLKSFGQVPKLKSLTKEDEEALASQQETQMIFFIQQANTSWRNMLEHTKNHQHHNIDLPLSPQTQPKVHGVQVLPKEPPQSVRKHDRAPASDAPRLPRGRSFEVRPREVVLAEMHSKESPRSNRSYRKEIWSAGDETYFNHFAEDMLKKESKDQERRIRDMLSIVEGSPSDTDERTDTPVKETAKPTPLVATARNFFENQEKPPEPKPVVQRRKSTEWKPKPVLQEPPIKPAPPPVVREKPVRVKPKPEPQNPADLPRIPPPDYKLPPEKTRLLTSRDSRTQTSDARTISTWKTCI
ncbi:TRAFAC class myosin-kinesin ATPase super [Desmophyllum pertusum]|uniref:non-specific serine/threonine protein kinase n=1 Tax=Desmophyllum pertusum TaxID=174260 RepID=A0A9W9YKA4_9CNID|nr:TRAFAC class myosin-kinesin ATPase super [Desmophyllum pertusum]